jgi:hypothetical protein
VERKTLSQKLFGSWLIAVSAVAGVIVLWFLSAWLIAFYFPNWQQQSQIQDIFGGVNALFAGLAFAGLILAIYLQSQELKLQRQELADTRAELAGQKEQLELQNKNFVHQRFESMFFQLLQLKNQIVDNLSIPSAQGRHVFKALYNQLGNIKQLGGQEDSDNLLIGIREHYAKFYDLQGEITAHYFSTLHYLIKFVDIQDVYDKTPYVELIETQLSIYEQLLLFYHCLGESSATDLKQLVDDYQLLDSMPIHALHVPGHVIFYDSLADKTPNQEALDRRNRPPQKRVRSRPY